MQVKSRQRGLSLIEVLVAVLIFSIGLVGMAGLLLMATRSNQAAYIRTQVTFLAQNMADRMHANPVGVWHGKYNVSFPNTTTQTCDKTTGCTPDQLANYDIQVWNSQLASFLPASTASINCDQTGAGFTPSLDQQSMGPPYGGNCHMTVSWSEHQTGDSNNVGDGNAAQTFTWDFQP
ncbi:type IV pilus modification protein PilV [Dyella sedimenti]|uniref:type IV pilus modification protein PilV n=1 Tax=Dyella sedimenti TaxID=2919947 RepID=UPI001FA95E44|nr:type IV pilus modification protein PilV [Dyella sedimenti]